jgi:pyruvate ferredoxin oxidoreductase beta subunit
MGLSSTSGAMERDLDFIYICYDNEGYGNTGQQYSGATPHAAKTATSKGAHGFAGYKKDLFSIWAAHKPAYVATVIGTEPLDLAHKIETVKSLVGPRMLIALAPCPTGWDYDPRQSVEIGKLAVKSGVWPLKEYRDGKVVHTRMPRERVSVEEYLQTQGRFAHLFTPQRDAALLAELQARVDAYWDTVEA